MVKRSEAIHVIWVANYQFIDQETEGDDTDSWGQKVHKCDTDHRWLLCLNFVLLGSYLNLSQHKEELKDWCSLEQTQYYVESIGNDTSSHAHIICITLFKSLVRRFLVIVAELAAIIHQVFVCVKVEKCWVIDYPSYDNREWAQVEHSERDYRDFSLLDHNAPKVED